MGTGILLIGGSNNETSLKNVRYFNCFTKEFSNMKEIEFCDSFSQNSCSIEKDIIFIYGSYHQLIEYQAKSV